MFNMSNNKKHRMHDKKRKHDPTKSSTKKQESELQIITGALERVVEQTQDQDGSIEQLQEDFESLSFKFSKAKQTISRLENIIDRIPALEEHIERMYEYIDSINTIVQSDNQLNGWMQEEAPKDATDFKMTKQEFIQGLNKYKSEKEYYAGK